MGEEIIKKSQVVVIGAGPAGLCAAIEARKAGATVLVLDENDRPGGQLFKQIHKFFGSGKHWAGLRGFRIGENLLKEAGQLGVKILLNAEVYGIFDDMTVGYIRNGVEKAIKGERIIIATGGIENALPFPGGTLPGVMGAGGVQTMVNIHRVLPGKKILMVGSGNVGVIVSYQLMQAGAEVVGIVEAAGRVRAYEVHLNKIKRAGVPIYTSHVVKEAIGKDEVEGAIITRVDDNLNIIEGSEKHLDVDCLCIAVGLNPQIELPYIAGCKFSYIPERGGYIPVFDENMETSVKGIYVAGDVAGIEEASIAMEEGRLAGIACAGSLGLYDKETEEKLKKEVKKILRAMRTKHDSRIIHSLTGIPSNDRFEKGPVAVIECKEEIPCNPCESACVFGAIKVGEPITNPPVLFEEKCTGCGRCIPKCPGMAIFLIHKNYTDKTSLIKFPYEYLPVPEKGGLVSCVNRNGEIISRGRIIDIKASKKDDGTKIIAMEIPKEYFNDVRGIQIRGDGI